MQRTAPLNNPKYHLLIEQSGYGNTLRGSIKCGNETVNHWGNRNLPPELLRFLASHYFYDSTARYFKMFQQITNGAYPIIFNTVTGRKITLQYAENHPCKAGIIFDIKGNEVHITRAYSDGTPLHAKTFLHKEMLFDLEAGIVMPIEDSEAWKTWESIIEELDTKNDDSEEDNYYEDYYSGEDDMYEESSISNPQLTFSEHTVIAAIELFNSRQIRFSDNSFRDSPKHNYFKLNGILQENLTTSKQIYILDIPEGITNIDTTLIPLSLFNNLSCTFSHPSFRLFNPYYKHNLSTQMKTRKRTKAVLEAAFTLLDQTKTVEKNRIFRSITGSSDFLKRDIKREAKQLLTFLADSWQKQLIISVASNNGWCFIEEELRREAILMNILYELFGLDSFLSDSSRIVLKLPTIKLLKVLPSLTERLKKEGFLLRIGNERLTEAVWEFALDATNSTLDWFELKPEIRCNGELLTDEELRGIFNSNGLLHRGGRLLLLDEISAQVLAMFSDAMPKYKKKKKDEQELVRVPRLQILDWLQLRSHGVQIKLAPDDAKIIESLINFSSIPIRTIPVTLNATLRQYQLEAWHWLAFLYEHHFGACLADDMGLGKTVQGIALLAGIMSGEVLSARPPETPHLVVAPPSLMFNWEAELQRFLPSARVLIYTGSGRNTSDFTNYDVIITSYGIVQRDSEALADINFNVLIFDETQLVKNLQASTSNAVRKLKGSFVLALTGTPVENHLGEYFAIMDLCLPGLLGLREEFTRKFSKDGTIGMTRLLSRTRPFILRRTKQLISNELPPKIEIDIPLELNTKQRIFYGRTVEEVKEQVKDAYANHAPSQARIIALTAILRLRQICLAPVLASIGASESSPKLDFLIEQLAELSEEGHSALVFSQFTSYMNLIEKGLKTSGFNCLRLDGSTPISQRKNLVEKFQNSSEPYIFLISLKAGGKGLNLTRATYVYHMDPWWNPAVENQASDRAHRIGQKEQVTITRLIMRHTIEEKMMILKEQKNKLYKTILENGSSGGGVSLGREDFEFLLN